MVLWGFAPRNDADGQSAKNCVLILIQMAINEYVDRQADRQTDVPFISTKASFHHSDPIT